MFQRSNSENEDFYVLRKNKKSPTSIMIIDFYMGKKWRRINENYVDYLQAILV